MEKRKKVYKSYEKTSVFPKKSNTIFYEDMDTKSFIL